MEGMIKFEDGTQYTGHWHGKLPSIKGNVVFFTGMNYFIEFLTDPALKDKIVVITFPGFFNSPIDVKKFESQRPQIAGLITLQDIQEHNHQHQEWVELLEEYSIPFITGADTRAIVKYLMANGEVNARLVSPYCESGTEKMSVGQYTYENKVFNKNKTKHLVVIDFGIKNSFVQWLTTLGYKMTILSKQIRASELKEINPDIVIFSGGEESPHQWEINKEEYVKMIKSFPIIGFGVGLQVVATVMGAEVESLKRGHRGFRQPVIHTQSNKIFMVSQNQGTVVKKETLMNTGLVPTFMNTQDNTVVGLSHPKYSINCYQFQPNGKNKELETFMSNSITHQLKRHKGEIIYA